MHNLHSPCPWHRSSYPPSREDVQVFNGCSYISGTNKLPCKTRHDIGVPLTPIISFSRNTSIIACATATVSCLSGTQTSTAVSLCPLHFIIPFVNLAQQDTEHPPIRCWAPSVCLWEYLSGASQDRSLRHWQTKGEGWGERIWLNKVLHLFGPVPVSYCSATMCHYLDCLHIICLFFFFSFCILTLAYSLFFLVIFNPWQQLLF